MTNPTATPELFPTRCWLCGDHTVMTAAEVVAAYLDVHGAPASHLTVAERFEVLNANTYGHGGATWCSDCVEREGE